MRSKLWLVCLFALVGMASNAYAEEFKVYRSGAWYTYTDDLDGAITNFNAYSNAILQLPAGTFHFNVQIQPRANSKILGSHPATTLVACPSLDETTLVKLQGDGVGIEDVAFTRLTDTRSSITGDGIDFGYANTAPDNVRRGVYLRRVGVLRNNLGITCKYSNGVLNVCTDVILDNVYVSHTTTSGLQLQTADLLMDHCKFQWTGDDGAKIIMLRQASNQLFQSHLKVHNCTFQGNVGNGLTLNGRPMGYDTEGCKMLVTGCLFDSVGLRCLALYNTCQVEIANNVIRGSGWDIDPPANGSFSGTWTAIVGQYTSGGLGIYVPSSNSDVIINGNTLNSHQISILVENSWDDPCYSETGPKNVVITDNNIFRGDWASGAPTGISILNSEQSPALIENVTINDNNIRGYYIGILQSGSTDGLVVVGNLLHNNGYDIYTSSPVNAIIEHNVCK